MWLRGIPDAGLRVAVQCVPRRMWRASSAVEHSVFPLRSTHGALSGLEWGSGAAVKGRLEGAVAAER